MCAYKINKDIGRYVSEKLVDIIIFIMNTISGQEVDNRALFS